MSSLIRLLLAYCIDVTGEYSQSHFPSTMLQNKSGFVANVGIQLRPRQFRAPVLIRVWFDAL